MTGALILCDLIAPDGTICGVELRQGATLAASFVCSDVLFSEDRWTARARAWIANARANGERIDDRRTIRLDALLPALDEPMEPRRWGEGWTCRYPGERPADQPIHATAKAAREAARARAVTDCMSGLIENIDRADQVETVYLRDGLETQHLAPGVAAVALHVRQIATELQRRSARRGTAPLPSGGLFDDVGRAQQDLFS